MKNILKIALITIIIALAIIIVSHYMVNAKTEESEEIVYKETIELNNRQEVVEETNRGQETSRNEEKVEFNLDNLVIKDKKYTTEYETSNGEKEITLITCYNRGTQRLVVKARAPKDETTIINKIIEILK